MCSHVTISSAPSVSVTQERTMAQPLPHYLVLNRFDDEFGEYHRFIDARQCRLSYLTLQAGVGVLDHDGAVALRVLDDLDFGTVLTEARAVIARHGPITGVVGLSE